MRFGVREICNVVLKAKAAQRVGKKIFYKNEPVLYFDTLKTSSMEGQSSTVYAQGGRGNPRLVAWEGERTVTFTMEDALISPEGLSILTGAGLIGATSDHPIYQHVTETIDINELNFGIRDTFTYIKVIEDGKDPYWKEQDSGVVVYRKNNNDNGWVKVPGTDRYPGGISDTQLNEKTSIENIQNTSLNKLLNSEFVEQGVLEIPLKYFPYTPINEGDSFAYVSFVKNGEIITEPYIPNHYSYEQDSKYGVKNLDEIDYEDLSSIEKGWKEKHYKGSIYLNKYNYFIPANSYADINNNSLTHIYNNDTQIPQESGGIPYQDSDKNKYIIRDYPFKIRNNQVFLGFDSVLVDYYRKVTDGATQIEISADKFGGNYYLEAETLFRTQDGLDLPAEFVIPNCKVQSNFNFAMSNTGDPSTFTFTMDAFPDYTRFDHTHKVFAAIQIIEDIQKEDLHRHSTGHEPAHDDLDWY